MTQSPLASSSWKLRTAESFLVLLTLLAFLPAGTARAQEPAAYTLDYGDTIRVQAIEWRGLEGLYTVGPDGMVAVPVVGTIAVRGKTVSQVAQAISEGLRAKSSLPDLPSVAAAIVKYRPYYILGFVQNPGEFEYQPDMTVLKAISRAGGFFRRNTSAFERLNRDSILARTELAVQRSIALQQRIRLARIEAELAGQDQVAMPPNIETAGMETQSKALLENEQGILSSARTAKAKKDETREALIKVSNEEIRSLELQVESETQQIALLESEKQRMASMSERGLTTTSRLVEGELNYARVVSSRQALFTLIIRARQDILKAEAQYQDFIASEEKRLRDERQVALTRLRDAELLQKRSRNLILEAEVLTAGAIRRLGATRGSYKIEIKRAAGNAVISLPATDDTAILPGDVINVEEDPAGLPFEALAAQGASAEASPLSN
jgi:protein involved in polysaccharide export with SLBB domain